MCQRTRFIGPWIVKHGPARVFADSTAHALLGFVEAVAQVQIARASGGGNGLIHLLVQRPERGEGLVMVPGQPLPRVFFHGGGM